MQCLTHMIELKIGESMENSKKMVVLNGDGMVNLKTIGFESGGTDWWYKYMTFNEFKIFADENSVSLIDGCIVDREDGYEYGIVVPSNEILN